MLNFNYFPYRGWRSYELPKFGKPSLVDIIYRIQDNLNDIEWQDFQAFLPEDRIDYIGLQKCNIIALKAAVDDYYTIAAEIKELIRQGDVPPLKLLLSELLKLLNQKQLLYIAMTHSLIESLDRAEIFIEYYYKKTNHVFNLAKLALFNYYINSGKLKNYHKKHSG